VRTDRRVRRSAVALGHGGHDSDVLADETEFDDMALLGRGA
jgi:hypothetical protein